MQDCFKTGDEVMLMKALAGKSDIRRLANENKQMIPSMVGVEAALCVQ